MHAGDLNPAQNPLTLPKVNGAYLSPNLRPKLVGIGAQNEVSWNDWCSPTGIRGIESEIIGRTVTISSQGQGDQMTMKVNYYIHIHRLCCLKVKMDHSEVVYTVNSEAEMMDDPATETTELFCQKGWNGKRIPLPPAPKFLEQEHTLGNQLWLIPNPLAACTKDKEVFAAGEATMEWCPERKFLLKIPTMEGLYMGELMRSDYFYQNNVIKSGIPNVELVQNLLIEARRCIKFNIRRLRTVGS